MKYLKEYIDWEEEEEDNNIYKDYPKDFKKFLIENNALKKFHNNISTYDLKTFFIKRYKLIWLTSFSWANSPEGWSYWGQLNNKWVFWER